jgi:hypothetical protein
MKKNTQLDYSPELKQAMVEIKAVLKKYDIAAHVLLHEPGFSEYLNAIEPSWSLISQPGDDNSGANEGTERQCPDGGQPG